MLPRFLPSKAAIYAFVAAVVAGLMAFLRFDAKRDQNQKNELEDYEHAENISASVSDSRANPDRLHKYDDAGYRD